MNAYILLVLSGAIASASAGITCYKGDSFSGTVPYLTYTNCGRCWKSVQTYKVNGQTYTYTQWGGDAGYDSDTCDKVPEATVGVVNTATYAATVPASTLWHAIYSTTAHKVTQDPGSCYAGYGIDYTLLNPTTTPYVAYTGTYNTATAARVYQCATYSRSTTCNTNDDAASYAICSCCSSNCNGNLGCSA